MYTCISLFYDTEEKKVARKKVHKKSHILLMRAGINIMSIIIIWMDHILHTMCDNYYAEYKYLSSYIVPTMDEKGDLFASQIDFRPLWCVTVTSGKGVAKGVAFAFAELQSRLIAQSLSLVI